VRNKTRRERYDSKLTEARTFPVSLTAINFHCDENLGYLIRSAACFGADSVNVIGCIPERSELRALSGSLVDYIQINQFSNPEEFLDYSRVEGIHLVSAELTSDSVNLERYSFDPKRKTSIIVGNETTGVPTQILVNSDVVNIEMPGVGFCLNTAQAANIMLYEAVKQYKKKENFFNSINNQSFAMLT
jgi:tRNA G18 (ribose-2'-O)-methylase SpoU